MVCAKNVKTWSFLLIARVARRAHGTLFLTALKADNTRTLNIQNRNATTNSE